LILLTGLAVDILISMIQFPALLIKSVLKVKACDLPRNRQAQLSSITSCYIFVRKQQSWEQFLVLLQ